MKELTEEQTDAIGRLQSDHGKDATSGERKQFMRAITSVPKEELETAPQPPKEKRGRKPAPKPSSSAPYGTA